MTLTTYNDLRAQFFANTFTPNARGKAGEVEEFTDDLPSKRGESFTMPYWTLFSSGFGEKDRPLAFNEKIASAEESFTLLAETIRRFNNPQGQVFTVFQTYRPRHNNGVYMRVQIYENQSASANIHVAGINGQQAVGYLSPAEVDERIQAALERQKMKDEIKALREANEGGFIGQLPKVFEQISNTPVGQAIIAKIMGLSLQPAPATAVNGVPGAAQNPEPAPAVHRNDDDDEQFNADIDHVTTTLGTDDVTLMKKIRILVDQNPDLAKTLLAQ